MLCLYIFLIILFCGGFFSCADEMEELRASEFHDKVFDAQNAYWLHNVSLATWFYESNMTEENMQMLREIMLGMDRFIKESWKVFSSYDWRNFQNETLKRLFYLNSDLGNAALESHKLKELTEDLLTMTQIYTKTTVCDFNNRQKCDLPLNPAVIGIMSKSRNFDELQFIWEEWHNKCGRPVRKIYENYVRLMNEAARLNGYNSNTERWLSKYGSDTFESDIDAIWEVVQPYFKELHAFVRRKLIGVYGEDKVKADGLIPAHILGDQWSQIWNPIYDLVVPFPNKKTLDVTDALVKQGYTAKGMVELADSFYQSLGLKEVPEAFWKFSIFTKPSDRKILCHATAWDMGPEDVRIRMCSRINMRDLITMHHELGHIQYYLQYKPLPSTFKQSANPGFHEAIGDTVALSIATPKHLKTIGLLDELVDDDESDINYLMLKALEKIAALPFAYLVDKYRWAVFRGEITPYNYNAKWWEMSKAFQGIQPPSLRTEEDFDAGTKMHVTSNYPYIRYFVATILQFQFHEALCRVAGEYDPNNPQKPLHECDIYGSKEAGEMFARMLRKGKSRPWEEVLEELTGTPRMDPTSLIRFFTPLFDYIRNENRKNNEYIGWRERKKPQWIGLPKKRLNGLEHNKLIRRFFY